MSRISSSDKHLNSTFYESHIEQRQTFEIVILSCIVIISHKCQLVNYLY
nr:MAG TPA: hypothetical protein [Caudoviricetes sp.]